MSELQWFSLYLYFITGLFWLSYLAMGSINFSNWEIKK